MLGAYVRLQTLTGVFDDRRLAELNTLLDNTTRD
jgi:hypothetical protein